MATEDLNNDDDTEAAILEHFQKQPAQLTKDQVYDIESKFTANEPWGPWRRSGMASLTMSAQALIDAIERDDETAKLFAQIGAQIGRYRERVAALCEMLEAADWRIAMALCFREDGVNLIHEAKVWANQSEGAPASPDDVDIDGILGRFRSK